MSGPKEPLVVTTVADRCGARHTGGRIGRFVRLASRRWPAACAAVLSIFILQSSIPPACADTHYVSLTGGHAWPFTNWVDAATNIQDAIDASSDGDTVLVTNGVYASGGRVVRYALTNRVAIDRVITVQSVNGPGVTVIVGGGTTNGPNGVRCAYVTNGASLVGFTLTNGHTRLSGTGASNEDCRAGGVWCDGRGAIVSNCVITGNSASGNGAGICGGTCVDSRLIGNFSEWWGGAAWDAVLLRCVVSENVAVWGGGMFQSTASNCVFSGNSASSGGGANASDLTGCHVYGNVAKNDGGGVYGGCV